MALNPIVYTEKVIRSFLRYQLTAYPFADERAARADASAAIARRNAALAPGRLAPQSRTGTSREWSEGLERN